MLSPIQDDRELVQCLRALLRYEGELEGRFEVMPEDTTWQHCLKLRVLVRDYLNADKRLPCAT